MTTPQPDAWANNPQYKQQPKPIAPPEPKQPQQQQAQPQQAQPQPIQHDTSQPWYQYGMSTVKGTEQGDLNNAIQRYLATPRNYWTWQRDEQAGLRGFWENPYRVARYHDVIQSAPDGWQPPDWLDVDGVKAAYKWFEQRNDNKPWYQWQQLPDDDPATPFLRGMKVPPDEYLWGGEEYFKRPLPQDYQAEQQRLQKINAITPQNVQQPQSELNTATEYAKRAEVKADPLQAMGYKRVQDWKDMPAWAKVYLSMFSGQPMQGRPAWSQATGSLLPSIPGVVGAAGTGAAIGGLVAGPPGAAIGMIGLPLLIGAEGAYENVTGSQVTGLADVFSVFDILAEGLERVVATPGGVIGASDGTAEGILKVLQDKELMGAIWQAGHMAQETSLDNPLLPGKQIIDLTRNLEAMAKENVGPADILLGNYKWQSTPEGMTWKLSQGYVEPVPVLNRNRTAPLNGNIQQEVIDRLWDGEPLETVYADILDRYGDVGAMNDFIGHLVYDPLNFVPAAATAAGVKVGDISGNPRLSAAFEAGKGNLLIDALPPGIQQLAEKLTGVQGTQSPLTAIRTYKAMVEGGMGFPEGAIPEAKDLHWMDKTVLGLDENGQYKELQAGSGKWYNYLRNMTPEAKSSTFIAMLMDNMSALSLEADDPNLDNIQKSQEVIKLVQQYANVRPVEAGQAGEAILKNPMTATTSAALRQVVKSGVLENMAAEWAADQPKVSMLENMAKILNVDSSVLVKDLKSDPQTVLLRLVETARKSQDPNAKGIVQDYENKVLTPESLKDQFAVFTDGNHSWKFGEWRAKTMLAIDDMAWDFTKEHFGIQESSAMNKFFMLAKAAQSALLLDLNPAYLVNNALNNWVTRAVEGVFGYMTKEQLNDWDNRFGLSPARLEMGLGTEEGGRLGKYIGDVRKINLGEGKLSEIIKNVNKTRHKFGLMSKLSGELEKSESRQAYTIAMKRTWDQLWRPGRGFDKMPAQLEQALRDVNPDLPGYVYSAIRSGMNMDEVINNIYKPAAAVNVTRSIDDAAAKIFKDNPDVAVQLIKDLGIDETLRARLANAKTVDDVDRAFNVFNREVDELLDRKSAMDILDAGDEAAEQVKAKGFSGAVELFNEMITSLTDHWVAHFGAIEDMLARLDEQDADFYKRNLAWRDLNERDSRSWKRINDFELQVTSGILRVLGIDNAAGAKYLELTRGNMDQWRDFYDGYDVNIVTGKRMTPQEIADNPMMVRHVPGSHDLWREYFATDWKKQAKGSAKAAAAQIKQTLSEMYQVHSSNEQNMQGELDNLFAQMFEQHTGRPAQEALQWRQGVWGIRQRMIEAMTAYRNDLMAGKATKTWQQFLDTEYKPLMLEMKKAEMVGAEKILWGEQAKPIEVEPLMPEAAVAAHVEAMEVLKEADAAKQEAQTKVDAHLNKDTLFKQMRDTFELGKDEYSAARMMADLHAERWAERTGRKADEWYASHLAGFLRGEGDVDLLQTFSRAPDVEHEWSTIAKKHFGVTDNIREAGYILPDGTLLDLSGRHYAGEYIKSGDRYVVEPGKPDYLRNTRSVDHRELPDEITDAIDYGNNPNKGMLEFMRETGAVRIDANAGLININSPLTNEQAKIIQNNFYSGWVEIDGIDGRPILNENFDNYGSRRMRDLLLRINGIVSGEGQPLFQNQSVLDLARQYGINTATGKGGPNDKYIINIVKKYTGVDVKSIDEVTPELAKQAFEERRIAKGLPAQIEQDAKGGVQFLHDGRAVIRAFKGADVSTLVHELAHVWRRDIDGNDLEAVAQWGGFKDAQEFTDFQQRFDAGKLSAAEKQRYVDAEEKFARGFERYLAEDNESIPPKMQSVFQRFAQWLLNIYKKIQGSDIDVDIKAQFDVNGQTIRIKDVFDRMLFSEEQLKLRNDKAEILKTRPVGNTTTAFGADPNRVYNFRYRLVSLDDLIASHDQNFNLTPGYPAELQPRMRDRAASQAQVNRIASDLSPIALLSDTRQLDRGIPIIGSDMVVESGNGRTLALRMAAQNYPQNYQDYINELAVRLPEYGLSEQDMQGLRNPVLVRERMDNVNRMDFVKEANQTAVLRMSPFEQALQDSESVNDTMLSVLEVGENQSIDQALQAAANINIIRAFVEMLPANERAAVVDANGNINSEGLNRLKNALFAKTYPGEAGQRLLKIFSESVNPVIKNIEAAMYSSLGNMAQAEGAIRSGYRAADLSIVDDISKAADVYARLKQNGLSVQDYLSQGSMFEQELNPFQQQLLAFIAENGRRSKALREMLNSYSVAVMNQPDPRQMGLFGEIPSVTKGEIFDAITREIQPEPEGLFAQAEAATEAATAPAPAPAEVEAAPVQTGRDKLAGVNILAQEPDGTTTYEINGETRNTGEGLFQSAPRDVTQTPEFKAWFGDSKVVDDEGDPLVVYHGTDAEFYVFDRDFSKKGPSKFGFWFSDDLNYSEFFGKNVMPEYIKIENPKNISQAEWDNIRTSHAGDSDWFSNWRDKLVFDGYDGLIVESEQDKLGNFVVRTPGVYAVFNPEQIKSVNNRGTFDPNNPNILYQTPAIGKTSQTPETLKEGKVLEESTREMIRPMLDEMREQSKNQVRNRQTVTDIPESAATGLRSYLNRVKSQMPSTKLTTMRMGEMTRDAALLNYQKRYPLDMALETVFPYQFWYTRSMMNWAMRMIDKPALFGMYAKFRNLQKKYEKKGVPSRLKGKLKNYASYLPDWAGGASYYDPMQQLFPPQQFLQPFNELATQQSAIAQQAVEILRSQAEDGDITRAQLDDAIKNRQGQLWETAMIKAKAEREEGVGNPFSLVTLMMSPALYLSVPYNIIKGTPEKISPLPGTRTAGAIETLLQDTPLDAVGKIVGLASRPERWARKAAGLSEFGEYGDFYVERQLSNMAAEGIATSDEVIRAMQDKQGALYDAAVQRVRMEQALRVPGALAVQAVKGGGTPAEVGSSLIVGLFPQSLFPEGELIHRGLKEEFDQAIKLYNMGDSSAFRKFFDEHPEYEARLALFKDPQERLRSYLVGKIWDQYTALTGPNKQIAQRQLGDDFNVMFLNDETRDYTAIDVDTLTGWARALGAATPQTANTSEAEANLIDFMPKEAADEIQKYWTERNQKFPNWNELQQGYFASGSNPAYLQRFPELQQYWEWKRSYELNNQTVRVYNRVLKDQYQQASGDPQEQEVQVIDQFQPQAQDVIKNYWNERDQKFKNWRAVQEGYYSGGRSKAYLAKFPELKQYWDWKRQQEQLHPEIKAYNEAAKQYYEDNPTFGGARSGTENAQQSLTPEQLAEMDDVLIRQVMEYYLTGNELSNGAATNLRYAWERQGKPGGYFEDYLNDVLRSAIIP